MSRTFGRDDMDFLLGGSKKEEEMAAFRPSHGGPQLVGNNRSAELPNARPDYSKMSAAEAAAALNEKNSKKIAANLQQPSRYRTQRTMAHHALAQELSENMQVKTEPTELRGSERVLKLETEQAVEQDDDDKDDEFIAARVHVKRERSAPQIVRRGRRVEESPTRRRGGRGSRRRGYDDSSSSDDSRRPARSSRRGRRRDSDSSSSSDDEEDNQRRQRLLRGRRKHEPEIVKPVRGEESSTIEVTRMEPREKEEVVPSETKEPEQTSQKSSQDEGKSSKISTERRAIHRRSSSSGGSSGSSSSSSDSDSSSDDSSSSEEEQVIAKPIFIPKSKRMMIKSDEQKWEEEEARAEREKIKADKRKMESRAMVAKSVAAVNEAGAFEGVDDDGAGAANPPPNDDDEVNPAKSRDEWEVRELERLLDAVDILKKREEERLEYERRKQMTDEEVLQHDKTTGRYNAPGSSRMENQPGQHSKKYFHRGAFYMAEDEWDKDDVRHKAAEYARAATGEDKVDRSAMPEVMKVKKFGFANQNSRYKGLANEDTTDKSLHFLPVSRKK